MTCIVGIAEAGKVWIGGDSAGGDSRYGLVVRSDRKVFRNGAFIFGFTSSFRMGQLLAFKLKPPKRHPDDNLMEWMTTEFIDEVRKTLKEGGYAKKDKEEESGGTFLVGCEGRLFVIHSDYQVGESSHGFDAVGCGDMIALGSLYATPATDPKERLLLALRAAETFSAGVRAPFHIETTGEAK